LIICHWSLAADARNRMPDGGLYSSLDTGHEYYSILLKHYTLIVIGLTISRNILFRVR
jgi:hypothetical protein